MSETCTIIIPTWNNPQYVVPCVNSILQHTMSRELIKILVINNGDRELEDFLTKHPQVEIIHAGKNLGWEGGLKLGLEHTSAPFVCFMNDDTYVPFSSMLWVLRCLSEFKNQNIAAVGPSSNVVRGAQNIFLDQFSGSATLYAKFLIALCLFVRRSDLDAAGSVDDTLSGGDDLDLSIRLRKLGKELAICRDVFVYHHGFKSGERLRGTSDKPGGWNSLEMQDATNHGLIQKHGFKAFIDCNYGGCENPDNPFHPNREVEADVVRKYIKPGVVYDLGCGAAKTVPESIGFDRVRMGDVIPNLEGHTSMADIQANIDEELPVPDESADTIVTRHILEHCTDTIKTLRLWISKLKHDGRLIITVPDERLGKMVPLNPEHVHAFTPESLLALMHLLGMKQTSLDDGYNGISFTACFEKNGAYHSDHAAH